MFRHLPIFVLFALLAMNCLQVQSAPQDAAAGPDAGAKPPTTVAPAAGGDAAHKMSTKHDDAAKPGEAGGAPAGGDMMHNTTMKSAGDMKMEMTTGGSGFNQLSAVVAIASAIILLKAY